jgi:cell division cycle 20-like protein 1 (cofactor of APC complex)
LYRSFLLPPQQDTSAAYSTLLRTELLGDLSASAVGLSPVKTSPGMGMDGARQYSHSSPSRNLFRFKSDGVAGLGTPPESPFSLSPVGGDGPLGTALASPRRSPRKIARSPFKVGLSLSLTPGGCQIGNVDMLAVINGMCVWTAK